jgi:hypothetical protein
VNGLPLDLLIEAHKRSGDSVKLFGVIFSYSPPDWDRYSIPVLWRRESAAGVGQWRLA